MYKCLHGLAPGYLSELLFDYTPNRNLRSSSKCLLQEPKSRLKTFGDRAFAVHAPRLWNILPEHIKNCESLESFKSALKHYLFDMEYN